MENIKKKDGKETNLLQGNQNTKFSSPNWKASKRIMRQVTHCPLE